MHRCKHQEAQHPKMVGQRREHCGPLLEMAPAFEEEPVQVVD